MVDYVGQRLGSYRILRLLGTGGFADVYLGEHVHLNTQAAIKVLHTRLGDKEMKGFLAEARTVAGLDHPNIVRVLEFDVRDDGVPFLIMTYAPNGTLRQSHPAGERLTLATILPYVKQLADALQYAHESKVIHRDVKPENILVGQHNKIMLSDFGIATVTRTSWVDTEQKVAGTAAYMAPEQIQGNPRNASDQYALGIVVYEWLVGERPFRGTFIETYTQQLSAAPPPLRAKNPAVSPEVERVVLTALNKNPLQRFPSVQAFADALEQASKSIQPTMLTCLQCGKPILPNAAFCGNCGYHLPTAGATQLTAQISKGEHTLPLVSRGTAVQQQIASWPTRNTRDSTISARPTTIQQPSHPPVLMSKKPGSKRNTLIVSAIFLVVLVLAGIGLYPSIIKSLSPATADLSCLASRQSLLFGDCFQDNTHNWDLTSQSNQYSASLSHNSLILQDDNNTWFSETIRGTPHIFTDFRLEVDADLSQGDAINSYGIVIRGVQDTSGRFKSYYRFQLFGNGQYAIDKSGMNLIDPTFSPAIRLQGSINHISITAKGSILTLSINNIVIKSITDSDYTNGYIALFVSNNPNAARTAQTTFSKLGIYQLGSSPTIIGSSPTTTSIPDFPTLMRLVRRYAGARGYLVGLPYFEQASLGVAYHVVLLKPDPSIDLQDVPRSRLDGDPNLGDETGSWRAINRYAVANGYLAGFPDFEQFDYQDGRGPVYGAVLLKPGPSIDFQDIPRSQLDGNPDLGDGAGCLRAINRYAVEHGYFAGFPTFEQADHLDGRGLVYGAVLLKSSSSINAYDASLTDLLS